MSHDALFMVFHPQLSVTGHLIIILWNKTRLDIEGKYLPMPSHNGFSTPCTNNVMRVLLHKAGLSHTYIDTKTCQRVYLIHCISVAVLLVKLIIILRRDLQSLTVGGQIQDTGELQHGISQSRAQHERHGEQAPPRRPVIQSLCRSHLLQSPGRELTQNQLQQSH